MNDKLLSSAVPALSRGLDVVEHLASTGASTTLSQLARNMGRSVSEIQRTVGCLLERGYLVRDDAGVLRLSSKLYRLAQAHPPHRELLARAYPAMADYARTTGESVHLAILAEGKLLLVAEAPGTGLARVSLQLGAVLDPELTVSGRLLLAFTPPALSGVTRIAPAVAKKIQAIRAQGHEFSESDYVEGILDLGVPILTPEGEAIAALTTSWLPLRKAKVRWTELLPPLQECARRIAANY
ncbi:MAG: helix-turn-helix domain-containing protein [Candidatus Didemnitutus sp.]|nr:helix-turn-helix domain-containing protein [Candidatus Didemnitutus sp.]